MANDAHEEFWGCNLSKEKKEYIWDPSADSEEDVEHKLQLTTVCLGAKAKDGERNLVIVTTENDDGKKITCPFASLRAGGKECFHVDLGFHNTTKFILKEGSGPVSLCGVHLRAMPLDFDEDEDSSEDEEVPDLVPDEPVTKKNTEIKTENKNDKKAGEKAQENAVDIKDKKKEAKQPSAAVKRPLDAEKKDEPAKKKKPAPEPVESDESEDDDEDEDMEDESEGDEEQTSFLDNEAESASDEDSDEGDEEPEEGDDVDSEDDEDEYSEDEDEDESEEEEKPTKKTQKVNGHATPAKAAPQKNKQQKTAATNGTKTPVTNKTPGKKDKDAKPQATPKSQAKKTPEEMKAMLLKSPNLPKKFDKFANFMKNNMKVVDEKTQKELWDYVNKNKK